MLLAGINPTIFSEDAWEVTYEVIFAHAFAVTENTDVAASVDGIVRIPLANLRQKLSGNERA